MKAEESWGLLVYHPSPHPDARRALEALKGRLNREQPGFRLIPVSTPPEEAARFASEAAPGARYVVAPLLIAPGRHFHEEVTRMADEIQRVRPDLRVELRSTLLDDEGLVGRILERLCG